MFNATNHFAEKSEYLPIITSNIVADLAVISAVFATTDYFSHTLTEWYKKYRLCAMMADILIGVLYILLARYLASRVFHWTSLWSFVALAVAIQIVGDFAFYLFFRAVPKGTNNMLDFFQYYAANVKWNAILGDSVLVVLAVLLAAFLNTYDFDTNVVALIVALYCVPFVIYMKD